MELNCIRLYQSSGKEKENCCFVFTSSKKREIRHYHVVIVQRRLRDAQKSVMHVQSSYFANLNLLGFCRFRCRRRCRCLSSLKNRKRGLGRPYTGFKSTAVSYPRLRIATEKIER